MHMKNDEKILSKRVDVVRVELVKEKSILFQGRYVKTPEQAVELVRNHFNIEWSDRECFIVVGLNVKSMPTHMNMVDHIILGQGCYCSLKEEGYL